MAADIYQRIADLRQQDLRWSAIGRIIAAEFGGSPDEERVRGLYRRWKHRGGAPPTTQAEAARTSYERKTERAAGEPDEGESAETAPPTYEEIVEEAKAKERKRFDEAAYRRLLTEKARTDLMCEVLERAVTALPRVTPKPFVIIKSRHQDEHAVLCISDVHIGEFVDLEQTGGLGAYDMGIFQQRMDNLKESVAEIIDIQRKSYNVPNLHVFFVGDIVTGEGIYRGQSNHIELDATEQVFEAVEQFSVMLAEFKHLFPEIHCTGVYGNHGRVGIKGENRLYTNWDRVAYWFMRKETSRQDGITWNIPKAWFALEDVLNSRFLISHGEQLKSQLGTPYYALDRFDAQQTKLHRKNPYDYVIVGHHHRAADIDATHGEKIMNSTWVGGSLFSLYEMGASTEPSQWFFGVAPKRGISWRYKLMLEDGDIEQVTG